jgi:hypothetical protein
VAQQDALYARWAAGLGLSGAAGIYRGRIEGLAVEVHTTFVGSRARPVRLVAPARVDAPLPATRAEHAPFWDEAFRTRSLERIDADGAGTEFSFAWSAPPTEIEHLLAWFDPASRGASLYRESPR